MTLRLLDLFCGGGMAADGYASVGFDVDGVDLHPQPHYPYPFRLANALDVLESDIPEDYDVIHASPPCQLFTAAKHLRDAQGSQSKETVDLLTPTLELLRWRWSNKVRVIENVERAKSLMPGAARMCGSSFHLQVQRHRLFLSNVPLRASKCAHKRFPLDPVTGKPRPWGVYRVKGDSIPSGGRTALTVEHGREVMGVHRPLPWDTLKEGFPPAYTAHVGADLLSNLMRRAA